MSLSGTTRKDQFLTNLALTYPTGSMIGTMVAPVKSGVRTADTVFADADDAIKLVNDLADVTPANRVNFQVGSGYSYKTTRKAVESVILDKTIENEETVVKSKIRETKKLTNILRLKHEYRVAAILTDTAKVTNYTTLSATTQFDNASYDNAFFTTRLNTAIASIRSNTGRKANTLVVPFEVAIYMANDTFIRSTLQYQYGMNIVANGWQEEAMRLINMPPYVKGLKVIIADGRMNNANEGETASKSNVWAKNVLVGYVPGNDMEDTFGVMTMEYEPFSVYEERLTNPKATKIIADWDYGILEADLSCWYLFQTAIS